MRRPAVFFDRDNTLIVGNDYLGDPDKVTLVVGAAAVVAQCREMGFAVVVVSNQSGVARGMFTEDDVAAVNRRMDEHLRAANPAAIVDRHEYCPHHPDGSVIAYRVECDCRKPKAGMIYDAAEAMALDLPASWLVGDAPRDIAAGKAAGCRTILIIDPTLAPSPAALQTADVQADFVVGSLIEAGEVITQAAAFAPPSPEQTDFSASASNPSHFNNPFIEPAIIDVAFVDDAPPTTGPTLASSDWNDSEAHSDSDGNAVNGEPTFEDPAPPESAHAEPPFEEATSEASDNVESTPAESVASAFTDAHWDETATTESTAHEPALTEPPSDEEAIAAARESAEAASESPRAESTENHQSNAPAFTADSSDTLANESPAAEGETVTSEGLPTEHAADDVVDDLLTRDIADELAAEPAELSDESTNPAEAAAADESVEPPTAEESDDPSAEAPAFESSVVRPAEPSAVVHDHASNEHTAGPLPTASHSFEAPMLENNPIATASADGSDDFAHDSEAAEQTPDVEMTLAATPANTDGTAVRENVSAATAETSNEADEASAETFDESPTDAPPSHTAATDASAESAAVALPASPSHTFESPVMENNPPAPAATPATVQMQSPPAAADSGAALSAAAMAGVSQRAVEPFAAAPGTPATPMPSGTASEVAASPMTSPMTAAPASDVESASPSPVTSSALSAATASPTSPASPTSTAASAPASLASILSQAEKATPVRVDVARLEALTQQVLMELKKLNDHRQDDFSISKLIAGIVQTLAVAALPLAYVLYRNEPGVMFAWLLTATFLQTFTIALLIMGRQR